MAGALKAPARPGGVVVAARGKSRKRDSTMPLIKAVGAIGGGIAAGFITERLINPESNFGKAAVNGGASGAGAFMLSTAFDKNNKLRNSLMAATGGVVVGSRDKLTEWADWLRSKVSGAKSTAPKVGDKRADGKVWNGTAWVSVYDTTAENGAFSATQQQQQAQQQQQQGPTYVTVQAPKTEKRSTLDTVLAGVFDVAGKVLPGVIQGALGSGASGARVMVRAY